MPSAEAASQWRSKDDVWIDHASLKPTDAAWLAPARCLTLWAVKVPDGFLVDLPNLVFLDLRGGSGTSAALVAGCHRLRYLQLNQIRGLTDLSVLPSLASLEFLSLYGLPKVTALPSLAPLSRLRRIELGSMKGLDGLGGVHDAPGLDELMLIRSVRVAPNDAERLAAHPTLTHFDWFPEDVPDRVLTPFLDAVGKPRATMGHARDWFATHGGL